MGAEPSIRCLARPPTPAHHLPDVFMPPASKERLLPSSDQKALKAREGREAERPESGSMAAATTFTQLGVG